MLYIDNFSLYLRCRLFSEYLGADKMLAIVCKTLKGVKALEAYDKEGCINKNAGLHGVGASMGRTLEGRFLVICLENLRHESYKLIVIDNLDFVL